MRDFSVFGKIDQIAVFLDGWIAGFDGEEYLSASQAIANLDALGYPTTDSNVAIYLNGVEDGVRRDAHRVDMALRDLEDMRRTVATLIEWRRDRHCA